MTDLQTMFCTPSPYCCLFEASLYHGDHSYSSAMSGTGNGVQHTGNASARSPRRSAQNANSHNGAVCGDESDRSASSSTAALANGSALLTNSIVSTNNSNGVGGGSYGKPSIPTSNTAHSSDRGNSIQELKKSLTLDFTNPESAKKSLQTQTPELLSFLRLTSPELEKFLTQGFSQGVSVVQTPTPTQFFFPKNVTTEQEQYARGFLDALNQIYQHNGFIPVNNILSPGFVANTVAQEAKEGTNKEQTGPTGTSSTSVFPGPSTSSVSFNAALVSNILAAISTPTLPNNGIPEPAFVTTVSTSGAQQFRQTLAAAAAAAASASASQPQHSSALYAFNPRPVAFPTSFSASVNTALPNVSSSTSAVAQRCSAAGSVALKSEPDERCTPSPNTYESRSSSVSSSYREQHSNISAVGDAAAAAALATMNRGGHQYASFHGGAGANFMQPNSHQFLALTNAAQLLISGHSQQFDHNLSSTASASSTASSVSGASTKVEICDERTVPSRFIPGAMPLAPEQQERMKLERKRARNRQAATKCRRRKIERIQTLEEEVTQMQDCNQNLEDRRDLLLNELHELRKLVEEHQRAKCGIAVPQHSSTASSLRFSDIS